MKKQNLIDRYGSIYDSDTIDRMHQAVQYIYENARWSNIPNKENIVMYAYLSVSGVQNQMSIAGLNEAEYGGVQVKKVDNNGNPLQGAEFTVYDASGRAVQTMVSNSKGIALICEYNAKGGLKVGQTYTVKETKAPNGYKKSDDTFTFKVEHPNLVVETGYRNGKAEKERMVFTNQPDKRETTNICLEF